LIGHNVHVNTNNNSNNNDQEYVKIQKRKPTTIRYNVIHILVYIRYNVIHIFGTGWILPKVQGSSLLFRVKIYTILLMDVDNKTHYDKNVVEFQYQYEN